MLQSYVDDVDDDVVDVDDDEGLEDQGMLWRACMDSRWGSRKVGVQKWVVSVKIMIRFILNL